jgi:hypothetical protein
MIAQKIQFAEIVSHSDVEDIAHAVLSELFKCDENPDLLRNDKYVSIEAVLAAVEKNLGDLIALSATDAIMLR